MDLLADSDPVLIGAECKRHKIKCFVQPGKTSCNKCLKAGIHCVPHNFAQKFIDDDAACVSQPSPNFQHSDSIIKALTDRVSDGKPKPQKPSTVSRMLSSTSSTITSSPT